MVCDSVCHAMWRWNHCILICMLRHRRCWRGRDNAAAITYREQLRANDVFSWKLLFVLVRATDSFCQMWRFLYRVSHFVDFYCHRSGIARFEWACVQRFQKGPSPCPSYRVVCMHTGSLHILGRPNMPKASHRSKSLKIFSNFRWNNYCLVYITIKVI